MKDYRPDIDGLRAVAVLAVLAFHAYPGSVRGGFIGVDVFFVISGYLISRIILEGLAQGTFSLTEFYRRRVGRIFPALLVVMLACYAIGWVTLLSNEFSHLGKHLAGGAGFVANILLWREAGYFDVSAETKPLLHLWSLGIEEQFYLAWPLILLLAWRIRLHLLVPLIGLALVSFLLNLKYIGGDPTGTFYLPHLRVWELLCGGILAWFALRQSAARAHPATGTAPAVEVRMTSGRSLLANASALIGAALLLAGFVRLSPSHAFPGVWALLPVLGCTLIILAGPQAWLNRRVLSHRIAVWIGLISFPLYLWHWPLLSFARILEGETPGRWVRLGLLAAAVVLAWLTYRFIEQPVRHRWQTRHQTLVLVSAMVLIGAVGYGTFRNNGLEFRTGEGLPRAEHDRLQQDLALAKQHCSDSFPAWSRLTDAKCRMQRPVRNTLAIIGDSHAAHLYAGMALLTRPDEGVAVFPASCAAPFIDIASATNDPAARRIRKDAYTLINQAYAHVIRDPDIRTVLLAHNPVCSAGDVIDMANPSNKDIGSVMRTGMARSFDALIQANKEVIVLYDTPFLPHDPAQCARRPFMSGLRTEKCSFDRAKFDSMPAFSRYKTMVESVRTAHPQVKTFDLAELFCDEKRCMIESEGHLLFSDNNHLSQRGSIHVASTLMEYIRSHPAPRVTPPIAQR